MTDQQRRIIFRIVATGLLLAAAFHLIAFALPSLNIRGAHWRHGLFITVNLIGAYYVQRRPPWFIYAFAIVTVQQLYSHGSHAWTLWLSERQLSWADCAALVGLPIALLMLWLDQLNKGARSER